MKLNDRVYDILKWTVLVVLPALSTFYSAVAPHFGWYSPGTVAEVNNAVCAFIGAMIGVSSVEYAKK